MQRERDHGRKNGWRAKNGEPKENDKRTERERERPCGKEDPRRQRGGKDGERRDWLRGGWNLGRNRNYRFSSKCWTGQTWPNCRNKERAGRIFYAKINRIFRDKCLPTCFQTVSSAIRSCRARGTLDHSLPLFYAAGIYLRESPEHTHTNTRTQTHTHTISCRHRRSRCNASITQSAFRELNEPNNCIEHLGALMVPRISFATLPRLFTLL